MNPSPDPRDPLERFIDQALRDLPPRRAPHSLESRVRAELERRLALPWWRKSFVHWPVAARAGFVLISAALVKVALMATVWVMAGLDPTQLKAALAPRLAWLEALSAISQTTVEFSNAVLQGIPPLWLYGGAAVVAATYVALFGLGAVAYRTFHQSR